jgi:putative type I restriction modification DNA specificity domain protein
MAKNKNVEISLEEKLRQALVPVDEQPYAIPSNWVWTRLGEIGEYKKGPFGSSLTKSMFVEKGIDTIKVYEQKNAIQKDDKIGNYYITKNYFLEAMTGFEVKPNDIIVSCAGTIGETYILPKNAEKGIINQALMKISLKDNIEKSYYLQYFDYFLKEESKEKSKGTAMKNIPPFKVFKEFPFPLPPLNEQKRIVEKLDFLFEKTKRAKEIIEEIKIDIENRKISILDRAFKGTLTSKWRSENKTSDVKELLKSINEEKIKKWEEDCLQAEKDGNKKPKKPTITEVKDMIVPVDEQPYKLPDSWVWVRLGDISELISGYAFDSHDFKIKGDFQVLRLGNVKDNFLVLDKQPVFVEKVVAEKANKCLCFENDILVTMTGTRNKRDYFFSTKISQNQKFYFNQRVGCIRCDNLKISNYIYYILKVKFILDQIFATETGSVNQGNISIKAIASLSIPLPPLEEQQEIVKVLDEVLENENKVKELLELEERIDILEKSILHKAFKGELGTQNSSDESALNLLKSIL